MATLFAINDVLIIPEDAFEHNGVQYPPGWVYTATPAERTAAGITTIEQEPRPDDFYASVYEDPVNLGQWVVVPYTTEQMKPRLAYYSKQRRMYREGAGVTHTLDGDTYLIPTDAITRQTFLNYRITADRPGVPIPIVHDFGTKVLEVAEAQIIQIEMKMENRVKGCAGVQLVLQTNIDAGTVTTKEEIDSAYDSVP